MATLNHQFTLPIESANDPLDRPLLTPDNVVLRGNLQVPTLGAGTSGSNGVVYKKEGSIFVEHDGDDRIISMTGHDWTSYEVHQLRLRISQLGYLGKTASAFPKLSPVQVFPRSMPASMGLGGTEIQVRGVHRPNGGLYLATGKDRYHTRPDSTPFMCWFDAAGPTSVVTSNLQIQRYGGGFCDIPKWFADGYLDGRDFGIGLGGYQSGVNSSHGPCLAATHRPADNAASISALPLLWYVYDGDWPTLQRIAAERNITEAEARKITRENRFPDYWGQVFDMPQPDGDIGYWQGAATGGGPFWIEHPNLRGLCYFSLQGRGEQMYKWPDGTQTQAFSKDWRTYLYVYDEADLVRVVQKEIKPWEVRGKYYLVSTWFAPAGTTANESKRISGVYYDPRDQFVYVLYRGTSSTNVPTLSVYEIQ